MNSLSDEKFRLLKCISGYCDLEMYEDAINECKRLIDIDPNDPDSHIQLGFHYEESGEIDKAIGCYSFMIEKFPKCSKPYINLGYIFETHKKRNDIAIVCYEKAFELDPNDDWALNNIGSILQKEGKWKNALSYYERACEVIKQNNKTPGCQVLQNLAWAYYRCREYRKAQHIYNSLIKKYSDNVSILSDLGCVNYKMSNYERALDLFEKTLSIQPNNKRYQRLYQAADKKIRK